MTNKNPNLFDILKSDLFSNSKENSKEKLSALKIYDAVDTYNQYNLIEGNIFNGNSKFSIMDDSFSETKITNLDKHLETLNKVSNIFSQENDIKDSELVNEVNIATLNMIGKNINLNLYDSANIGKFPLNPSKLSFNFSDPTIARIEGIHEIPMAKLPTYDAIMSSGLVHSGISIFNSFLRFDFYASLVKAGDITRFSGLVGDPELYPQIGYTLHPISLIGSGFALPSSIEMEYNNNLGVPMLYLKYKDYAYKSKLNYFFENGIIEEYQWGLNTLPAGFTIDLSSSFADVFSNLVYAHDGVVFKLAMIWLSRVIKQMNPNTFREHYVSHVFMPVLFRRYLQTTYVSVTGTGDGTFSGISSTLQGTTMTVEQVIEQEIGKINYCGRIDDMLIIRSLEDFTFTEGRLFMSSLREYPQRLDAVVSPRYGINSYVMEQAITGFLTSNRDKIIRVILPNLVNQAFAFNPRSNALADLGMIDQTGVAEQVHIITPTYNKTTGEMTTTVTDEPTISNLYNGTPIGTKDVSENINQVSLDNGSQDSENNNS